MCRWPFFFGPAVPGAIAPVIAPDDWTQEVGVRKCRLYTKPSGGGEGGSLGYFQAGNTEELDSNPYTFTTMNDYIPDPTNRLKIENGIVTVGEGVSVIGLALSCSIPSALHNKYYGVSVLKNSNTVANCIRVTGTTSDPMQSDTFEIPLTIIDVQEGDEIQFRVSGGNGEYCSIKANVIILK